MQAGATMELPRAPWGNVYVVLTPGHEWDPAGVNTGIPRSNPENRDYEGTHTEDELHATSRTPRIPDVRIA